MFNNYTEFINNQTGNITTTKDESEGDAFGIAIVFFIFLFVGRFMIKRDCNKSNEEAVQRAKNRIYEKNVSRKGLIIV